MTTSSRATFLPITRGEVHLCYAITEENAGSDPAAIEATAERHGDSYVINAEKWHVTSLQSREPHGRPGAHQGRRA